ncbi:MAG TPA: TonB-dependent receptor [Burkholderiales bacterium]|nr:TonB-dependent receptor [Burkholderiales bacterium]
MLRPLLRHAAGFLAGAFICICYAQDDVVIITAPRFPEEVRRLPASVTVITEEDIRRSAARTLPELLAGEVGFTTKDLYGNNAAYTSTDLRGFGVTGPQNTLVLLDGRRLNDFDLSGVQWPAIPLASIERVEIVRGSGGVLYGDGAVAGIVNIVTRSPLTPGRSLELAGRTASYQTLEGQLYGSYGGGAFGANASIHGYRSEGYRRNNRNEQQNNTLNLRWAVGNGAVDLRFGTDQQDIRLPGGRFVQPSIGLDEYSSDRRGAATPLDYASRDGARARLTVLQRLGAAELSVSLDTRDKEQRSYFDQGGFPTYRADDLELRSLTPRMKLPVGKHTLVAGLDLHEWRYRSRRTDRPENLARATNRVSVDQETRGLYVQDTIQLRPTTVAVAGLRSERAKYAGEDVVDPAAPACFFCSAAPAVHETQTQRAWELGLREAFTPAWAGFARTGRAFRFVNAEEAYESDVNFAPQFQILRPQSARTYEGGVEWRQGSRAVRATLFRIDVSDEIHLDPFTTGVGNTNLPPSRRQGMELDGRWRAGRAITLNAGYAYTQARFREGTLPGSPFAIGTNMPIEGRTVPLVPRHKLNLGAAWDFAPRTRLSGALTAVSEQVMDNDEPNTFGRRIPSYYLVDVKLVQTLSWGRIGATINNLFNEQYYDYAVRSAFTPDRYSVYPLPGRTLSLTAEVLLR